MFQVYGIGQALIPVLPPPLPFENPPTSNQTNYEIGQLVFTPPQNPTAFYLYGGGGKWVQFASSSGDIIAINGTAGQVSVSTVAGTATVSLPAAITTPGSLTTTTTLSAGTTITAGTGITATTGNIVASAGSISTTVGNITAANSLSALAGSVSAGTSVTAGTTVTATLGNITATNGNLVAAGTGNGIVVPPVIVAAAASPQTANGRAFAVTFSEVSIAALATQTFVINNSAVNTQALIAMIGATTGAALNIQSVTYSAGVSITIVVENGTGAFTSSANITFTGLCLN
jgi:hypothetical protein